MDDELEKVVISIAHQIPGIDAPLIALYQKIGKALRTEFDNVDSGLGLGAMDFHVKFGDIEYHVKVTPSKSLTSNMPS